MKRDKVDILLQLAFLEGSITTHGLYEMAVAKRGSLIASSLAATSRLQKNLEKALEAKTLAHQSATTVGVFLRQWRSAQAVRPQEISLRLGLSPNIYSMLEHDRISPLKISVEVWKKLRSLFRISTDELMEMIRRTHQLVLFRPSFRMTLARYDSRKNRAMKARILRQGVEELYARAALEIPQEEKKKLEAFLSALKKN